MRQSHRRRGPGRVPAARADARERRRGDADRHGEPQRSRACRACVIDSPAGDRSRPPSIWCRSATATSSTCPARSSRGRTRRGGGRSRHAMSRHALTARKIGPFAASRPSGSAAADAVLNTGATACIVFNDLLAIGMLTRLRERGVVVPTDLSVVGCDDIFGADFCHPPLTTLTAPIEQAGRVAVTMLLSRLERQRLARASRCCCRRTCKYASRPVRRRARGVSSSVRPGSVLAPALLVFRRYGLFRLLFGRKRPSRGSSGELR